MSTSNKFSLKAFLQTRHGQVVLILVIIFLFVMGGSLPKAIRNGNASRFAKPLFGHTVPADSTVVQTYAEQQKNDGKVVTFATVILRSSLSEEELLAFYQDKEYPPAKTGDKVSLQVLPVKEDALTVLKSAGLYEEGGTYWYIYLYSAPEEE